MQVNRLERRLQLDRERLRRLCLESTAAMYACGPGLDEHGEVAGRERSQLAGLLRLERVVHEVADRREHARR